jgi:hypothetical protein
LGLFSYALTLVFSFGVGMSFTFTLFLVSSEGLFKTMPEMTVTTYDVLLMIDAETWIENVFLCRWMYFYGSVGIVPIALYFWREFTHIPEYTGHAWLSIGWAVMIGTVIPYL